MPLRKLFPIVLVALGSATAQNMQHPAGPVQPAALTALNDAFRAAYAAAKTRVLTASGPTLVVSGDNFALLRKGERVEANVGTPVYDPVKTIAHIPLAIYVTLEASTSSGSRRWPASANSSRPPRPASMP